MIGQLNGKVLEINPPELLLDVGGVGYEIMCPIPSFDEITNNANIVLYTHLNIKDDAHTLYGFTSKDDKTIFRELIRVNGIGPKVALAILSHLNVAMIIDCIHNEDDQMLAKTPGIGKKTAKKMIVELKDRLDKISLNNYSNNTNTTTSNQNLKQAYNALKELGFKAKETDKMLTKIDDNNATVVEIVRSALKNK